MNEDKAIFNSKFVVGEIYNHLGMIFMVDSIEVKDGECRVEATQLGVISRLIYKTVRRLRAIYDLIISRKISRLVKQTKRSCDDE